MKNDNTALIVVVVVLAIFLFSGFGMMGFGNYGMMSGFYGGFGSMWLFGWIFMSLTLVALVLFILWLIKQLNLEGKR